MSQLVRFLSRACSSVLSRNASPLAGLDIGRSELRMVEFSGTRMQTARLECCAREALPDGAIGDEGIGNLRQVMEAVSRLWEKSRSQARQVAIAIPSTRAITLLLAVPAHSSRAQRAALAERHAESLLPYPPAQALLDFRIIGPTRNAPDQLDMLIAAVRRDDVEDRIAVAESLGLQAVIADIDSHAAAAALNRTPPATPTSAVFALVNLETHGALLSLCRDGHIAGEQQLAIGHRQLQRDLQQYDDDHPDVLATYLAHAAAHIARAMQTLQQQTSCVPSHIVLTGSGATIPGMEQAVRKHTTASTAGGGFSGAPPRGEKPKPHDRQHRRGDAFHRHRHGPRHRPRADSSGRTGLRNGMRPGLAALRPMNGFNFLAQRNQALDAHRRLYLLLAATTTAGLAVVLTLAWHIAGQAEQQQQLLTLLRTEHTRLDAAISLGKLQDEKIAELERKRRHLEALQQQRNHAPQLLGELAQRMPPQVFLTSLVQQGRNFTLSGSAPSHRHVMQLLEALRDADGAQCSPCFQQVELQEARSTMNANPASATASAIAPGRLHDFVITGRRAGPPQ